MSRPDGSTPSRLAAAAPHSPGNGWRANDARAELNRRRTGWYRAYAGTRGGHRRLRDGGIIHPSNVLAVTAVWKLGTIPQTALRELPDAEFAALLDLKPRALMVSGQIPVASQHVPGDFHGPHDISDSPLPKRFHQPGSRLMASARAVPNSSRPAATASSTLSRD